MKLFRLLLLCLTTFISYFSHAQFGSQNLVSISAYSESKVFKPGDSTWILIQAEIKPNWHAYWKTSGQTGFPTTITWNLPKGAKVSPLYFPTPQYYEFNGLGSYVHEGVLYLMAELTLDAGWDISKALKVEGTFSTLVCDESSCIPYRSDFSLSLNIGAQTELNPKVSNLLKQAKAKLPVPFDEEIISSLKVNQDFMDLSIRSEILKGLDLADFYFFPIGDFFEHGTTQSFFSDSNGTTIGIRLKRNLEIAPPDRIEGVLFHPKFEKSFHLDLGFEEILYGVKFDERIAFSLNSKVQDRDENLENDYLLLQILFSFILLGLAAWIYGKTNQPSHSKAKKTVGKLLSLLALGLAIWIGFPKENNSSNTLNWENWSPELEESLREQGKAVYVDFTAKWCLSCQVNKRVFRSQEIIEVFREKEIVPLKADWTKRGATILQALQAKEREGVPLNIYYPPSGDGILLPEVLTEKMVLQVLENEKSYLVEEASGFWTILGFALLGGIILNLMPCVFPVIGLKIMSFVKQSGQDAKKVKMHGLVFTLGVLVSFWVLLGALLSLREQLENEFGWGFQLQEPVFVFGLAVFLFIFALSLSGVLEFGISLTGVGAKISRTDGYGGSFFSGALATVVATPCMAPFLGVAVGAALTMDWLGAYTVFTCIALGLSLPYLLLCIFPAWIAQLPKPGQWMDTLKQFMAFPLYATVAWLLWTLQSLL